MHGNVHVRFGGGPLEKARASGTSSAAYPTTLMLPTSGCLTGASTGKPSASPSRVGPTLPSIRLAAGWCPTATVCPCCARPPMLTLFSIATATTSGWSRPCLKRRHTAGCPGAPGRSSNGRSPARWQALTRHSTPMRQTSAASAKQCLRRSVSLPPIPCGGSRRPATRFPLTSRRRLFAESCWRYPHLMCSATGYRCAIASA